jgi:hypothetical protein
MHQDDSERQMDTTSAPGSEDSETQTQQGAASRSLANPRRIRRA